MNEEEREKNKREMIAFADKYLAPYRVKGKAKDKTEEIIPKYCPF